MTILIDLILILCSIVLIVAVLMQEGQKQGIGAIAGGAETFFGKNKAKSYEGKLLLITKIGAAVFIVLAVLLTRINSIEYTITYEDANGTATSSYHAGEKVYSHIVAPQEGYDAKWDTEIPETMPRKDITVKAIYTANDYTITYVVNEETVQTDTYTFGDEVTELAVPAQEGKIAEWVPAVPATMTAGNMTVTATYYDPTYTLTYVVDGETLSEIEVDYKGAVEMIEVPEKEGFTGAWDQTISVMPGNDVTVNAVYEAIVEPTEDVAEPTEDVVEPVVEEGAAE